MKNLKSFYEQYKDYPSHLQVRGSTITDFEIVVSLRIYNSNVFVDFYNPIYDKIDCYVFSQKDYKSDLFGHMVKLSKLGKRYAKLKRL